MAMATSHTRNSSEDSGKDLYDVCITAAILFENRDELTKRRLGMVEKAFAMLDRDGSGVITIQDISGIYDVSMNPEFLEGRKTRDEILTDFLGNFEGAKGNGDGKITKQEFVDYYTDLSMSTPSDEYFVRMMESTW